jgi:glutamate--cysteine ligase
VGLEYEVFLFHESLSRRATAQEIQTILANWQRHEGTPLMEGSEIIGMHLKHGALTLEPGGQFEFSAPPVKSLDEANSLFTAIIARLITLAKELNLTLIPLGSDPLTHLEERFWMPKGRYAVMAPYMKKVGTLGQEMMTGTCTSQVNLDFSSETDMVQKLRVALALQPLATALFANSPFTHGRANGYQSYRRYIWQHTDSDRCGILPFAFDDGMGFERYVDYALDVPLYFVKRKGHYINVAGRSFRTFLKGNLPELKGQKPTLNDWNDHLTTLFPEVRVKHILEMRGADAAPLPQPLTLAAFWMGLLYNADALSFCLDYIRPWSVQDLEAITLALPIEGLKTQTPSGTLWDVAKVIVPRARQGYARETAPSSFDPLALLDEIVATGKTASDHLLEGLAREKSVTSLLQKRFGLNGTTP